MASKSRRTTVAPRMDESGGDARGDGESGGDACGGGRVTGESGGDARVARKAIQRAAIGKVECEKAEKEAA